MTRKNESITLSVSPIAKQGLERLAREHGCMWGDRPNISALIEAIGAGKLSISGAPDSTARINALSQNPDVWEFLNMVRAIDSDRA